MRMRIGGGLLALALAASAQAQMGRKSNICGSWNNYCNGGTSSGGGGGGGGTYGPGPDLSKLIEAFFTLPAGDKAMLEGWQALKAGDASRAESKFREALGHDRYLHQAHLGLAEIHLSRGQLEAAMEAAEKARRLAPPGERESRRLIGRIQSAWAKQRGAARARKPSRRRRLQSPATKAGLERKARERLAAKGNPRRDKVEAGLAALKAKRAARDQAFGKGAVRPADAGLSDRPVDRPGGPQASARGQLGSAAGHSERADRMVKTAPSPRDVSSERQRQEAGKGFDTRGEGAGPAGGAGSPPVPTVDGRAVGRFQAPAVPSAAMANPRVALHEKARVRAEARWAELEGERLRVQALPESDPARAMRLVELGQQQGVAEAQVHYHRVMVEEGWRQASPP